MPITKDYLHKALFLAVTAAVIYLFYKVTAPFFVPIIWAGVFAILFSPLFERLAPRMHNRSLAALFVALMIIVLIIVPIGFLFAQLLDQASTAVTKIQEMYKSGQLDRLIALDVPWMVALRLELGKYFDVSGLRLDQLIPQILDKASGFIVGQTSAAITNGAKAILHFLIMIIATYYFLKDGHLLIARIKSVIPLPIDQVNKTVRDLRDLISITMYSGVAVAVLQGVLGWLLFVIMGIDSPVFWGAVMGFLSLLPLFGAFLVYIPAGLILLISGSPVKGLLTIGIGTVVISQVDNVIRPWIISGRSQMHPLLTFFSILGGIAAFGFVGVVIGPVIAALFMVLMDIIAERRFTAPERPTSAS